MVPHLIYATCYAQMHSFFLSGTIPCNQPCSQEVTINHLVKWMFIVMAGYDEGPPFPPTSHPRAYALPQPSNSLVEPGVDTCALVGSLRPSVSH